MYSIFTILQFLSDLQDMRDACVLKTGEKYWLHYNFVRPTIPPYSYNRHNLSSDKSFFLQNAIIFIHFAILKKKMRLNNIQSSRIFNLFI